MLGLLFFLVYVNDIQNVVGNRGVKRYADDTDLYHSGTNSILATAGLQMNLQLVHH